MSKTVIIDYIKKNHFYGAMFNKETLNMLLKNLNENENIKDKDEINIVMKKYLKYSRLHNKYFFNFKQINSV